MYKFQKWISIFYKQHLLYSCLVYELWSKHGLSKGNFLQLVSKCYCRILMWHFVNTYYQCLVAMRNLRSYYRHWMDWEICYYWMPSRYHQIGQLGTYYSLMVLLVSNRKTISHMTLRKLEVLLLYFHLLIARCWRLREIMLVLRNQGSKVIHLHLLSNTYSTCLVCCTSLCKRMASKFASP